MGRQYWKPGNMLYPLPAVMVSCRRGEEKANIITVAWAGTVCTNPAMLSISVRPERYSYDIIKETGEFVVNLVTKDLVYAADYCGVRSGRDVDKFETLGLHESKTQVVSVPGIEESPVNIECRVKEIKELGSHHMFIAEIVSVNIDDAYLNHTGKFDLNASMLAVYSHGEYFELGQEIGSFGYSVRRSRKGIVNAKDSGKKSLNKKNFDKKGLGKKNSDKKGLGKKKSDKKGSGKKNSDRKSSGRKGSDRKSSDSKSSDRKSLE